MSEVFRPGDVLFSLMSQYTPQPGAEGKLARRVTRAEYRSAVAYMENCGIIGGYTDGTLRPLGTASRAEVAKMLTVFMERIVG